MITISMRIEDKSNLVGDAKTKAGLHHHCVGRVRAQPGHLSMIFLVIIFIIVNIIITGLWPMGPGWIVGWVNF